MNQENIFELKTRKKIYNFILNYPGLHKRELCRKLNIPYTNLEYHLNYLIRRSVIIESFDDRFVRYYVANNVSEMDKKILHLLRQELPRKIILNLIYRLDPSLTDIARDLNKDPRTIAFHLNKFKKAGILQQIPDGNKIKYRLDKYDLIIDSLITYEKKLFDEEVSGFIKNIIKNGFMQSTDNVMNVFWDAIPHPYHV